MKQQWNVLNVDLIKLQQNSSIDSLYIASFNDAVTLGLKKQKTTEICKSAYLAKSDSVAGFCW